MNLVWTSSIRVFVEGTSRKTILSDKSFIPTIQKPKTSPSRPLPNQIIIMVQYRVYTEIRLLEKRSFRRSQNKRKRTEEAAQNRRDNRAAERERLAVEDPAALAAKHATRRAKHERKLARKAQAAAAAATAGASTQVLGEAVVSEPGISKPVTAGASTQVLGEALVSEPAASRPVTVDASTKVLGETVVDDSNIVNYDIGCEGYSDDEDYEYDNDHVVADEGFTFQLVPTSPRNPASRPLEQWQINY